MSYDIEKPPYKKYILFAYAAYYPGGGMDDLVGSFDSIEEAQDYKKKHHGRMYGEIVDRDTWEIVELF